jgi:hypothetical protein
VSVTYFTAVSNELLSDLRSGGQLPAVLRLKREVGPIVSQYGEGMTLVEFEDDEAPPELAGRTVTPTILSYYDEQGVQTHTAVTRRDLDSTGWQVVP